LPKEKGFNSAHWAAFFSMIYSRFGEDAVRLLFGDSIDHKVNESVRRTYFFLKKTPLPEVIDIIPSFRSCLVRFDSGQISAAQLISLLREKEDEILGLEVPEPVTHEIPVRYGGKSGPDLPFVSSFAGLDPEEVIAIHTATVYTVFAVGFMPGFPYLGILNKRLYAPRLETPRVKVPKGSVGLAQLQTGIYPFDSPGGWQIIGKTDVTFFDYQKEPYSLFQIGDKVKFTKQ
jgi:inhibitor of KinA